jgi:glycerol-3-phosphate acyltransferase PlsY
VGPLAVLLAYLLGSVSFPYWFARSRGIDLGKVGSRKLGASNLGRVAGPGVALPAGILDGAKGFAAVLLARAAGLPPEVQLACGVAAVAGQMWPAFHRFDGGRANATGWGFALAADPVAALIMAIPLVSALLLRWIVRPHPTRLLPLAALLSFGVWTAVIWEIEGVTPAVVAGLAVLGLILVRRLTAGIHADLELGAPAGRVLLNRALFDRSELQQRGMVAI